MPLTRVLKFKRQKSGVAIPPLGSATHAPSHLFAPTQQPHDIPSKTKRPKSGAAISAPARVSHIPIPPLGSATHAPSHLFASTQQPHDILSKAKRPKSGAAINAPTRVSQIPSTHAPSHPFAPTQQPHDMPQASSQKHFVPVEPPLAPLEPTPPQASIPSMGSHSSDPGRKSSRVWTVQAIDEQGNQKKIQLRIFGVFDMPKDQRIIVPFDRQLRACGEAAALLSGACGHIATEPNNIPINYESWAAVPYSYKKDCLETLKNLFHFQASDSIAERYCLLTMGRKYRNFKLNLWNMNFDPLYSREQLIHNVLDGIPKDQWSSFVDYRLKPDYQELCRKNAEARKKQIIPHTGGSKLLSRKQHEMEMEVGRAVSRGELYIATHKKKDGSYVNEEARFIVEQIEQVSQTINSTEISSNDALAKVLGPDHSGHVRGLGLGGLHSIAFGSTSMRFSGIFCDLSRTYSAECSQMKEEVNSLKTKLAASEESVKILITITFSYIQMKEGHIPTGLGALLETFTSTGSKE